MPCPYKRRGPVLLRPASQRDESLHHARYSCIGRPENTKGTEKSLIFSVPFVYVNVPGFTAGRC